MHGLLSSPVINENIGKQFPLRRKWDSTHKKDTLQAHCKHLEMFCLHMYTFKPSRQVKYLGC